MNRPIILGFWQDRSGAFAPIAAILMTVLLGFGALTVDMGFNYYTRNKLQVTADASALAGAQELDALTEDDDQGPLVAEAVAYAEKNMPAADYDGNAVLAPGADVLVDGDLTAGYWDSAARTFTVGETPYNAVRTITRRQESSNNAVPAFLGGIAGFSSYDIAASAIAIQTVGGPTFPTGCIMATSSHEEDALEIKGTATISSPSCSIQVASDHPCAISANGTPLVTTVDGGGTMTAGGYCPTSAVTWTPPPETNADLSNFNDPYDERDPCDEPGWAENRSCQDAANGQCDHTNATYTDSDVIQPGIYCGGISWTGSGEATFAPGEYIIKDGPLDIGGSIAINGQEVGFYLMGAGSVINFTGNSDVGLIAPSSGPMQGFVFYEEEKQIKETHNLRGTNGGGYDGVLYFDGDINIVGTVGSGLDPSFISDCTVLMANTIHFTGTSGLVADATCAGDGATLPPGELEIVYRLVD